MEAWHEARPLLNNARRNAVHYSCRKHIEEGANLTEQNIPTVIHGDGSISDLWGSCSLAERGTFV